MVIKDFFSDWKDALALPDHTAQTLADKLIFYAYLEHLLKFEDLEISSVLGIAKSRDTIPNLMVLI